MAKKRNNYIITNVLCIKGYEAIVINDLIPHINTKYPIWWLTTNTFDFKLEFDFYNHSLIYLDGFDIGFDEFSMK